MGISTCTHIFALLEENLFHNQQTYLAHRVLFLNMSPQLCLFSYVVLKNKKC